MYSSTIPQQGAVLVHPGSQRKLCQQGEPMREKPVSVRMNRGQRSVVVASMVGKVRWFSV